MNKIPTGLILLALACSVSACKPTYRTVPDKANHKQQAQTLPQGEENTSPAKTEEPTADSYADCLMKVHISTLEYNLLRPWEKTNPGTDTTSAVYIGDGKVLVNDISPENVTYLELSLPDDSRTVPTRIVRYDTDLNLALVTVAHEEDASIFDTRRAYPVGDALRLGDRAELECTVDGTIPTSIPVVAESGEDNGSYPLMNMKAARPLPSQLYGSGAPIIRDGKLVALTNNYSKETLSLSCINAEFLQRFVNEEKTAGSAPVLGIQFETLDDPVFRRYLRLDDRQCGLYVHKVQPTGAAAEAGIEVGDVLTAIEGQDLDSRGQWQHPIYGSMPVGVIIRHLKPHGGRISLSIFRAGEKREVSVPLNRDALDNALPNREKPGVPPRYIVWGGLLFQPLTAEYLDTLRSKAGGLPVQFLEIEKREQELREKGVKEIVALTLVIPTPATLGYESSAYSIVEKVNGREIHDFRDFEEALDAPTPDGLLHLTLNRAPFDIYLDRQAAEAANDTLRRNAIYRLRRVDE